MALKILHLWVVHPTSKLNFVYPAVLMGSLSFWELQKFTNFVTKVKFAFLEPEGIRMHCIIDKNIALFSVFLSFFSGILLFFTTFMNLHFVVWHLIVISTIFTSFSGLGKHVYSPLSYHDLLSVGFERNWADLYFYRSWRKELYRLYGGITIDCVLHIFSTAFQK